ncbi:acetamidase/formamidase family protein [Algiphilus sp.]|uniref:acetamidase/formamidase family protein n=1 Tax=Algiphilus sp. TaxID=1872431 RepID=UPI0025BADC31|nr:acetamidase/formamidase family protein [Algiphilus sp.]MCK5770508.1 acetamidase/formamidase family protein [Algiphilus sp.]
MNAHTLHDHARHFGWNRDNAPALTVAPGDRIAVPCADASGGQITRDSDVTAISALKPERANPLSGPIHVDGAEPGDALAVRIESLAPSGWGWTANIPGFGLLADDFPDPHLIISRHDETRVDFLGGIRLPVRPFIGTIGVAPAEAGTHPVIPPYRTGGNMDCRDLVAGATLWLPVAVPGALLSLGDTHVAQGDGEVCGTAIEAAMDVALRIELHKGAAPASPMLEVPPGPLRSEHDAGFVVTTGIGPDLMEAAREAVRRLIEQITRRCRLDPADAYCLASVAADLRISEIVDAPNWMVSAYLPKAIID